MPGFRQLKLAAQLFLQTLVRPAPTALYETPSTESSPAPTCARNRTRNEVSCSYEAKIAQKQQQWHRANSAIRTWYWCAMGCAVLLAIIGSFSIVRHAFPFGVSLAPVVLGVLFLIKIHRSRRREQDAKSLIEYYRDRLRRVQHNWMGKGDAGLDLTLDCHANAADLDLFGTGSLFELLCNVQTPAGRETLGRWLQQPCVIDEAVSRQQAIASLAECDQLREEIALLRVGEANEYSWDTLRAWLSAPPVDFPIWAQPTALLLPLSLVIIGMLWWFAILGPHVALWMVAAVIAAEGTVALALRRRVVLTMEGLLLSVRKMHSIGRFCTLLENQDFDDSLLFDLHRRLQGSSGCFALLQRLLVRWDFRNDEWFFYLFRLLMWSTRYAIRIERWRQRHGKDILEHFSTLGEFETLMAIAAYAHENPGDVYPEFTVDGPLLESAGLGHPLLDPATCVRNNIELNHEAPFLMVTGSNMSGKSTLLRAVGMNVTLAWIGAPVRATRFRLSRLQVWTSVRVEDSLQGGLSHFRAEVNRLSEMLQRASTQPHVLFLIDEIFSGTNSADRRVATEAVLRLLVTRGSIGLVTSHDLALTEIAEIPSLGGANVHFSDSENSIGLSFDYRLRPGKLTHGNALKILRMMGIPI